jgi:hypothetical protein
MFYSRPPDRHFASQTRNCESRLQSSDTNFDSRTTSFAKVQLVQKFTESKFVIPNFGEREETTPVGVLYSALVYSGVLKIRL